jgi:hypothetical protein
MPHEADDQAGHGREDVEGPAEAKGVCPECGTAVTRFLSEKESKK